jgi:hypothetical protein
VGEDAKGTRLIFTGTAHAKYEMTILDECYMIFSVVFVGPLSRTVFSKLLDTYPRLAAPAIREEVIAITNCVPRELVNLSAKVEDLPEPISVDDLQEWTESRTKYYLSIAKTYYASRTQFRKNDFYKALLQTFLTALAQSDLTGTSWISDSSIGAKISSRVELAIIFYAAPPRVVVTLHFPDTPKRQDQRWHGK